MKYSTFKIKEIIKKYPLPKEEIIEILTDLEEKGLIRGVGKNKIKLSPDAERLMQWAVFESAERNKDVV